MRRPDWTYGFFYRAWSRLLHRFNLHHTREIGPLEDGATITKCEWCGLSRRNSNRPPGEMPAHPDLPICDVPTLDVPSRIEGQFLTDEWPYPDDPPDPL